MKRITLSLAAAGCALALPAPALAASGDSASVASIYEAGRCIVGTNRRAAVSLLRTLPLDGDVADLSVLRGSVASCARGADGAPVMTLRGAIAQALFFRDFHRFGRMPQIETVLANLNLPIESSPAGEPAANLYRWSDCVVRNDTPGTERLLRSEVDSEAETAALEGLRNYMSACIAEGTRIRVSMTEARSLIAQSAYNTMYRYWSGQLSAANRRRN